MRLKDSFKKAAALVCAAAICLVGLAGCARSAPDPAHETSVIADDFAQDLGAARVKLQSLVSEDAPPPSGGVETDGFPPGQTVVSGRVEAIDGVIADGGDKTWYVAFVTISVDEVLQGSVDGETLRAVTAAATNEEVEWLSDPRVGGLAAGQSSTFRLRGTDGMTWEIKDLSFAVSDLAEFSLIGIG